MTRKKMPNQDLLRNPGLSPLVDRQRSSMIQSPGPVPEEMAATSIPEKSAMVAKTSRELLLCAQARQVQARRLKRMEPRRPAPTRTGTAYRRS
jgi:hypothetical protein